MKTLLYMLKFASGKSYIGITTCTIRRRINLHLNQAKSRDNAVHRAIRKYGRHGMQVRVLAVGPRDYILEVERRAIAAFGALVPDGYNQTDGGEIGKVRGEEKATLIAMLRTPYGQYRHTDEAKRKISAAGIGRVFSVERRAKIGASKIGNKYGIGHKVSEETREKIAAAQRGVPRPYGRIGDITRGKPWSAARRAAQEAKSS